MKLEAWIAVGSVMVALASLTYNLHQGGRTDERRLTRLEEQFDQVNDALAGIDPLRSSVNDLKAQLLAQSDSLGQQKQRTDLLNARLDRLTKDELHSLRVRLSLAEAKSEIRRKDYGKALEKVEAALFLDPENVLAFALKGDIFLQQNSPGTALPFYTAGLRVDPSSYANLFGLGTVYLRLDHYERAQEIFYDLLGRRPDDELLLFNLGLTEAMLYRYDHSRERFRRVYSGIGPHREKAGLYLALVILLQSSPQPSPQAVTLLCQSTDGRHFLMQLLNGFSGSYAVAQYVEVQKLATRLTSNQDFREFRTTLADQTGCQE